MRSQADYNRHFVLDATSLSEELERVEALFSIVKPLLSSRGVAAPES